MGDFHFFFLESEIYLADSAPPLPPLYYSLTTYANLIDHNQLSANCKAISLRF